MEAFMGTLRKEVNTKLNNLLRDVKDIQKSIILLKQEKKKSAKAKASKWENLGKKISDNWKGASVVDEIRDQRDKQW
jgi:hypothetical protein